LVEDWKWEEYSWVNVWYGVNKKLSQFDNFQYLSLQEIMVYLTGKLNKKLVILTFGQFDHLTYWTS
jgi:hypothetical protein